MSEGVGKLEKEMDEGRPVYLAHGVIVDDDDAIHWVKGQGLYATVVLSGKFDGARCKCEVGGSLFSASPRGRIHSEPLASGDHVIVALVEGDPRGHAVIISRNVNASSPPTADDVAYRGLHEVNLAKHHVDKYEVGASRFEELENGSYFMRMKGKGNWTVKFPDGSVIDATQDPVRGGVQIKIKHGGGACVLVSGTGVQMKSPSGGSWLQVDDAGVVIASDKVVRTQGVTMLDMKAGADAPVGQSVALCTVGPSGPAVFGSSRVYAGK